MATPLSKHPHKLNKQWRHHSTFVLHFSCLRVWNYKRKQTISCITCVKFSNLMVVPSLSGQMHQCNLPSASQVYMSIWSPFHWNHSLESIHEFQPTNWVTDPIIIVKHEMQVTLQQTQTNPGGSGGEWGWRGMTSLQEFSCLQKLGLSHYFIHCKSAHSTYR